MEKCIFIGYPQGYKGWKFYNPDIKKVLISEHADFDEHFFMLQKRSVPHLPFPRPNSLLETPSPSSVCLPETLDDSMNDLGDLQSSQLPVHGGGGSTASDLPPVCSQSLQTPPSTYLSLPPLSPSPSKPITIPDTPPLPAAPSHPQCITGPRSEQLPEQWAVPHNYEQIKEHTPAIPSTDDEDGDSDDPIDLINVHSASVTEGSSYRQSQQCPEAQLWNTACEEEMEAHSLNGTWDIVKFVKRRV